MKTNGSPTRTIEVVASYDTYADAQRALDFLADRNFPVDRVSIQATDIQIVEQSMPPIRWTRALVKGTGAGAVPGAIIAFVFAMFGLVTPLASGVILAISGAVIGGVIGAVLGLVAYRFSGGRGNSFSFKRLETGRYDVVVEAGAAKEARQTLTKGGLAA